MVYSMIRANWRGCFCKGRCGNSTCWINAKLEFQQGVWICQGVLWDSILTFGIYIDHGEVEGNMPVLKWKARSLGALRIIRFAVVRTAILLPLIRSSLSVLYRSHSRAGGVVVFKVADLGWQLDNVEAAVIHQFSEEKWSRNLVLRGNFSSSATPLSTPAITPSPSQQ